MLLSLQLHDCPNTLFKCQLLAYTQEVSSTDAHSRATHLANAL